MTMCMEDIKIGRKSTSREVDFLTIATVAQEILSGSDSRIAVLLGAPILGTLTYSTNPKPTTGAGYNITAGQVPLLLSIQDIGDLVRKQWWVVDDGTGRSGAISETILPEA